MPENFVQRFAWMRKDMKSKWYKKEEWKLKVLPNYYEIPPREINIDFDFPEKETNEKVMLHCSNILKKKKFFHCAYDTGGKGYHLKLIFPELEHYYPEHTQALKEGFVKWVFPKALAKDFLEKDDSSLKNNRLLGMEGQPHRTTGKIKKKVLDFYGEKSNIYAKELLKQVLKEQKKKSLTTNNQYPKKEFRSICAVVELSLTKPFGSGGVGHQRLVPNVVAIKKNHSDWEKFCKTQNRKITELENWAKAEPEFKCWQLQNYSKNKGLWKTTCNNCTYRRVLTWLKKRKQKAN